MYQFYAENDYINGKSALSAMTNNKQGKKPNEIVQ